MEYFTRLLQDKKVDEAGKPAFDMINFQQDEFYADAYNCYAFGALMYDNARSPLTNAIEREIFLNTFNEIFGAFIQVGTFESYLTVFRKIFGDDVAVEFIVPSAGVLNINIQANSTQLSQAIVRQILDNEYHYFNLQTHDDDNIKFQTFKGIESQYELELLLNELIPAGIHSVVTLDLD